MPSLAALAPEQRAALDLVLRQGRSYGELAGLLDLPEAEVRRRAHAALAALAPPPGELSAEEAGRVADVLLGRQDGAATRDVLDSGPARAWAQALEPALRELGGERVPALPAPAPAAARRPRRASSLALAGGLLAVLAVALAFLFLAGGDDGADPAADARATPTPTPTATAPALRPAGEVTLRAAGGSRAEGVMALFAAADGRLAFTIGAEGVPRSEPGEAYAVWFLREDGAPRRLGFTDPVGEDGRLVAGGPQSRDADRFPRLLATADEVVLARASSERATRPGRVVLRGRLPGATPRRR